MSEIEANDHGGALRALELTSCEVNLLLKYASPFPAQEASLRTSKVVAGYHRVSIDAYWVGMMLADISRSARQIRSHRLLDELDALCSVMEHALAVTDGRVQLR